MKPYRNCLLPGAWIVLAGIGLYVDPGSAALVSEVKKVTAPASDCHFAAGFGSGDQFNAEATLLVVGALGANDTLGAAYVYERDLGGSNNWGLRKKLVPTIRTADERFGWQTTVSGDTIAVGARPGGFPYDWSTGAAYLFERHAGGENNWGQVKRFTDPSANWFGAWVELDQDTLVVPAGKDDQAATDAGACYVYERNQGGNNNWGLVKKITAPDAAAGDLFAFTGGGLSGNTLAIGAPGDDDAGTDSGSVYVFDRNQGGQNNWGLVTKITPSPGQISAEFGTRIELWGDIMVVGVPLEDANETDAGAVYIYERNLGGPNQWGLARRVAASDGGAHDQMGWHFAMDEDLLAVTAYGDIATYLKPGAVYLFERNRGGPGNWGETTKILPNLEYPADTPIFGGLGVDLCNGLLSVGAVGDPGCGRQGNFGGGAVYLYRVLTELPPVEIVRQGDQVAISWQDVPGVSCALEQSPSLAPPSWSLLPHGQDNPCLLPVDGSAGFYRLRSVTDLRITVQPTRLWVLAGLSVSFSVTAVGEGTLHYQWLFNGTPITGNDTATSRILVLPNVQTTDAGDYAVVVTDDLGSVTSAPARLTVSGP